MLVLLSNRILG